MLFHESRFATRVHDFDAEDDPAVLQILRVKGGSARTRGRHKDQMQMRSYFGDFNRSVEHAALWGWPRGRRGASTHSNGKLEVRPGIRTSSPSGGASGGPARIAEPRWERFW